jgi:hypothetical protein
MRGAGTNMAHASDNDGRRRRGRGAGSARVGARGTLVSDGREEVNNLIILILPLSLFTLHSGFGQS